MTYVQERYRPPVPSKLWIPTIQTYDFISDDFNRGDQSLNGSVSAEGWAWGITTGVIDIVSNEAVATQTGPNRARAERELSSPDMYVRGRGTNSLADVANQNVNLGARCSNGTNAQLHMYIAQFRFTGGGQVTFFRTVNGSSVNISGNGSVTLVPDTYYDFRFEVSGPLDNALLVAYVNNVEILSFTDTGAVAAGFSPGRKAGFALQEPSTGTSRLDDFEAGVDFPFDTSMPPARKDQLFVPSLRDYDPWNVSGWL